MPTILVPIDMSIRSDRALRRAIMLAKSSGSELRLLHVVEEPTLPDPIPVGGIFPVSIDDLRSRLARIADGVCAHDGVKCSSAVRTGAPVEQIILECELVGAALIVTAPHRSRLSDLIIDSTAMSLAKKGAAPVLIANELPAGGYHRILVPTDLEPGSVEAIRMADRLPLGGPHKLFAMYVVDPLSPLRFASSQDHEAYLRDETKAAEANLRSFLEKNDLIDRVEPGTALNRSTYALEIEQAASDLGCDLIIISTSEKSFFEKLVIGSVSEAVVREVQSDIIIVH